MLDYTARRCPFSPDFVRLAAESRRAASPSSTIRPPRFGSFAAADAMSSSSLAPRASRWPPSPRPRGSSGARDPRRLRPARGARGGRARLRPTTPFASAGPSRRVRGRRPPDAPEASGSDAPAEGSSYGAAMQSVNVAGVSLFAGMALGPSKQLAIPHCEVPDIRWIDWRALRDAGFRACVFDKDNTLTVPYADAIHPPVAQALAECVSVFGAENVAVLSNSAGLEQYDPTGAVADALEAALGIGFVRHASKKPGGGAGALVDRFGCATDEMVMIGDRYLTDVVYGNRHGMLTVRCAPFTDAGESRAIGAAKWIEAFAVARWRWKPPPGDGEDERCPGRKPHTRVPSGKNANAFVLDPGVW